MGAGVALFDYDNDGDLDVFLVQGGPLGADAAASARPDSRLFRNDLTVARRRQARRCTSPTSPRRPASRCAATAWARPSATTTTTATSTSSSRRSARTTLLPQQRRRHVHATSPQQAGVSDPLWSTSAAFVDYDRDGDLDLFVANYLDFTLAGNKLCTRPGRRAATTAARAPTGRCRTACIATTATAASSTSPSAAGISQGRRRGPRRRGRRLQRRRLARSLRRQRRDAEPALDQSPRRHASPTKGCSRVRR